MGVELLVFDWSGVISDDRRPVYEANIRILRRYDKPIMSFEKWLSKTKMTAAEFFKSQGINGKDGELSSLYERCYEESVESGIVPVIYPDVHYIFDFLRKKKVRSVVLSSHPTGSLLREILDYKLGYCFDTILGSSRDKVKGLQLICNGFKVDPESVFYIGDTVHDIRAAKKAGVHSVAVCTGYHTRERLREENPEFLLGSLSELKRII